jgi:uncharacterized repeat protein (TIGR04076 family)
MWALQSLLPVITPKEREILEERDQDWMWRVHHAQCPDPEGRVIFEIEQVGKIEKEELDERVEKKREREGIGELGSGKVGAETGGALRSLRVVMEEVKGKCTSGMRVGDFFVLHSGRLYIPADRHFCLYALHAVLPMLPAKQRRLEEGDWLKDAHRAICPDPAGNVVMRIEPYS